MQRSPTGLPFDTSGWGMGGMAAEMGWGMFIEPQIMEAMKSRGYVPSGVGMSYNHVSAARQHRMGGLTDDLRRDARSLDDPRIRRLMESAVRKAYGNISKEEMNSRVSRGAEFVQQYGQWMPSQMRDLFDGGGSYGDIGVAAAEGFNVSGSGLDSVASIRRRAKQMQTSMAAVMEKDGIMNTGFTRGLKKRDIGDITSALGRAGSLGNNAADWTSNVGNAVKAVDALRDAMGDPNAPIPELMETLTKLSDGLSKKGLANATEAVKKAQLLADMTGQSVQTMVQKLEASTTYHQGAGLDSSSAVNAQSQSMLSGAALWQAARDRGVNITKDQANKLVDRRSKGGVESDAWNRFSGISAAVQAAPGGSLEEKIAAVMKSTSFSDKEKTALGQILYKTFTGGTLTADEEHQRLSSVDSAGNAAQWGELVRGYTDSPSARQAFGQSAFGAQAAEGMGNAHLQRLFANEFTTTLSRSMDLGALSKDDRFAAVDALSRASSTDEQREILQGLVGKGGKFKGNADIGSALASLEGVNIQGMSGQLMLANNGSSEIRQRLAAQLAADSKLMDYIKAISAGGSGGLQAGISKLVDTFATSNGDESISDFLARGLGIKSSDVAGIDKEFRDEAEAKYTSLQGSYAKRKTSMDRLDAINGELGALTSRDPNSLSADEKQRIVALNKEKLEAIESEKKLTAEIKRTSAEFAALSSTLESLGAIAGRSRSEDEDTALRRASRVLLDPNESQVNKGDAVSGSLDVLNAKLERLEAEQQNGTNDSDEVKKKRADLIKDGQALRQELEEKSKLNSLSAAEGKRVSEINDAVRNANVTSNSVQDIAVAAAASKKAQEAAKSVERDRNGNPVLPPSTVTQTTTVTKAGAVLTESQTKQTSAPNGTSVSDTTSVGNENNSLWDSDLKMWSPNA